MSTIKCQQSVVARKILASCAIQNEQSICIWSVCTILLESPPPATFTLKVLVFVLAAFFAEHMYVRRYVSCSKQHQQKEIGTIEGPLKYYLQVVHLEGPGQR